MIDDKIKESLEKIKLGLSEEALEVFENPTLNPIQTHLYTDAAFFDELNQEVQEQWEERREHERRMVEGIERIASNTDFLAQTVNILRINADRQVELLEVISEILALANEQDKEVAENKLKQILNGLHGFKENFELGQFLYEIGQHVINL